jgi:Fe-S cluster biogenesis protein NfuA
LIFNLEYLCGEMEKEITVVTVYAESTPNPAAMKFVASTMLLNQGSVEYLNAEQAVDCPLAQQLFNFDGVASVFIASNFVTVNKKPDFDWFDLMPILRQFIKSYLESGEKIFLLAEIKNKKSEIVEGNIENKIIQALDEYVKPAVEQDGGAIHFKSFHDGVVTLILKGSCSGCPSSLITLKAGIERLLTQLIPEVVEVVAEEV